MGTPSTPKNILLNTENLNISTEDEIESMHHNYNSLQYIDQSDHSNASERTSDNFDDVSVATDASDNESNQPVAVRSPVIQIKKNIDDEKEINKTFLNNLDKNQQKFIKNKVLNPETKTKAKSKSRNVKVKSKFTQTSLEFISEELKGSIFSGWVKEREYVENLKAYRDIVEIDEWEDTLNHKLKMVMHGVKGVMEGTKWINITVPSNHSPCYCLWVLLSSAPIPGHYWMQVSDITSDPQFGLKISLKILREINPFDGESRDDREKRLKGDILPNEWKEWALSITSFNLKSLASSTLALLTPSNISNGFRLCVVLFVTLVIALSTLLRHVGLFLLRFIREFGIFIHHATPFGQTVIGFFEKMVGGFFLLIAMVYRDFRQPKNQPPPPYSFGRRMPIGPPPPPLPPFPPVAYVPPESWEFHDDDESD